MCLSLFSAFPYERVVESSVKPKIPILLMRYEMEAACRPPSPPVIPAPYRSHSLVFLRHRGGRFANTGRRSSNEASSWRIRAKHRRCESILFGLERKLETSYMVLQRKLSLHLIDPTNAALPCPPAGIRGTKKRKERLKLLPSRPQPQPSSF